MSLAFATPTEWLLEIPTDVQAECWQSSQTLASAARRYGFYLNQLCLTVFLPWFQQEYASDASLWLDQNRIFSLWDLVDGSCLTVGTQRIVLLPTDSIDSDAVEVPQEWVDIPAWRADYYLAIQINFSRNCLRVWGYTTHQRLGQSAVYDSTDRTYCLEAQALIRDLSTFWIVCQRCPQTETRGAIAPLPAPSVDELERAISELSQSRSQFLRLLLPFELWGAIISHSAWRQQLYECRLTPAASQDLPAGALEKSSTTNLTDWFEGRSPVNWQLLETFFGREILLITQRSVVVGTEIGANQRRVKSITLGAESEPQTLLLLIALNSETDGRSGIRVQLHPMTQELRMPPDVVMEMYSMSDDLLERVQSYGQEDYLRLPYFRCWPDTQFQLRIALYADTFSETFAV